MKKMINLLMLLMLMLFSGLTAQNQLKENEIKSALTKIFDLSKELNYSAASNLLLFTKNNEVRNYNFSNKSEAKLVIRLVKKIKAYLDLSDSYEYESLANSTWNKLQSSELKINFKSGDQELTISFIFVKTGDKILLAQFK